MGYTHYFSKVKDVPDEQWHLLYQKVSEIFHLLQSHEVRDDFYTDHPIIICDGMGRKHIKKAKKLFIKDHGTRYILFNGKAADEMDHETFVLRNKGKQDGLDTFCKTARKPYDWFVTAILILTHNICPDCYEISSDGNQEDWRTVHIWLCRVLNTLYQLPPHIKY